MNQTNLLKNINKIILFAAPISAGMLINMAVSFIAMIMVAKLGKTQLAAGALGVSTLTTVTVTASIFYSISIMIGMKKGQNQPMSEIGKLVKNGWWLAIFLALPVSILLWHCDDLLILFKQDPLLVSLTRNYFHFAAISMLPMLLNAVIFQFFMGMGKSKWVMIVSIINLPIALCLAYGFILGNFHLPALGLAGVSCAICIVQAMTLICLFTWLYIGKSYQQYKFFSQGLWPDWSICKSIFSLGLPIGIQFGAELSAMAVATYFIGQFGVNALAATQAVTQYSMLLVMVMLGLSQALAVCVGEAYGRQDIHLIKEYLLASICILFAFFGLIYAAFYFAPDQLLNIFISGQTNDDVMDLAKIFFVISGITLTIDGLRNLLSAALRGMYDSKAPMQIGVICLWLISLPVSYVIGFIILDNPTGLRLGFISGFIIASLFLYARINKKLKIAFDEKEISLQTNSERVA